MGEWARWGLGSKGRVGVETGVEETRLGVEGPSGGQGGGAGDTVGVE